MILSKRHMAILFLGIEDCSGLWEILWEQVFYELPETNRIELARSVVEELSDAGFLSLYRSQEPSGPRREIPSEDRDLVLSESESWMPPHERPEAVRFKTTSEGKRAYWEAEAQ